MTTSPVVSVRGEASIEAEPELAVLSITVDAHGNDRHSALNLLSQRARAVSDVIGRFEAGIERSETSQLHVYPELDNKKTEKIRRYVGRSTTSLTVHDFGVLSDLLVAASAIELVSIDGPWWRLRSDSDVYRQARLAAARNALTRARDYADAYGAKITGLIEIADQGMSQQHQPERRMPLFASASHESAGGPGFDLEPGVQEVVGHIEARFMLTQPDLSVL